MAERKDRGSNLDRLADLVGDLNDITGDDSLVDDSLGGELDADETRIAKNLAILGRIGAFRPDDDDATSDHPETIGPYHLRERIGTGGMGDVYLAEQTAPLQRTVALKIIKPGMDSREVIRRFELERQTLAAMDHPHIAKVFDAGMADNGRPYFVMEHVDGEAITAYCDHRRLDNAARLDLFRQVCAGVQHAHQKGIIHRDLKPSNVLVTEVDGRPQPRIIDFGVARATEPDLAGGTLFTEDGRLVGTPEYMSPEQATLTGADIDTRTDIYSLGVLLYELIVGRLPFESDTLRLAGLAEIQRILREVDPPRPSARLATLSGESDIGTNRATSTPLLRRQVSGDLDWIVMKALAKEPGRRYDSAAAFADDVRRHVEHEPVLAGPPGVGYRVSKFTRRHRGAVVAAALVVAALIVGLAGTTWQSVQATRARDEAQRQAEIAQAVNSFFIDTFGHRDPLQTGGETGLSVAEAMDRAAVRIGDAYADDPALELELRRVIGRAYMRLGEWERAQEHLDRAWELATAVPDAPRLGLMRELGELARDRGELDAAARWFAAGDSALAGQADPNPRERIANLHLRGTLARLAGDFAAADSLLTLAASVRDSLPAGTADPDLGLDSDRADLLAARGEHAAADSAFAAFAGRVTALHGPRHPWLAWADGRRADLALTVGDLARADSLAGSAIARAEAVYGRRSTDVAQFLGVRGRIRQERGEADAARADLVEARDLCRDLFGPDHRKTALAWNNLAALQQTTGDGAAAQASYAAALQAYEAAGAPRHETSNLRNNMATLMRVNGEVEAAAAQFALVREDFVATHGERSVQVAVVTHNLARCQADLGRYAEADASYREAVGILADLVPAGHPNLAIMNGNRGDALRRAGRLAEAGELLDASYASLSGQLGADHPRTRIVAGYLADLQDARGDAAGAAAWRAKSGQ